MILQPHSLGLWESASFYLKTLPLVSYITIYYKLQEDF